MNELVNGHRMRRCRYHGVSKAHVQHVLTTIAINIERLSTRNRKTPPTAPAHRRRSSSTSTRTTYPAPAGGARPMIKKSQDPRHSRSIGRGVRGADRRPADRRRPSGQPAAGLLRRHHPRHARRPLQRGRLRLPRIGRRARSFPQLRLLTPAAIAPRHGKGSGDPTRLADLLDYLDERVLATADAGLFGFDLWCRAEQTGAELLWRVGARPRTAQGEGSGRRPLSGAHLRAVGQHRSPRAPTSGRPRRTRSRSRTGSAGKGGGEATRRRSWSATRRVVGRCRPVRVK